MKYWTAIILLILSLRATAHEVRPAYFELSEQAPGVFRAGWALLLRRVGSLDGWAIARSLTRMHLATVPGLVFALAVMAGAGHIAHPIERSGVSSARAGHRWRR